ncbi:MAG: glutathione S-transferase [Myxococcota bacterium]
MKFYETEGFPNPIRVRIALKEKGLFEGVTVVPVDVMAGEHRAPAFLAKNPFAAVPALELDDGTVLAECTAITEYIDHATGEPTLTGRDAKERGVIAMTQRRIESCLLDAIGAYFHHATPGLGPELETNQNAAWGEAQRERAVTMMHTVDGWLADQPFVAGDAFTVADITTYAALVFAGFAKIDVPESCENLRRWHADVSQRPSIAA